eukprot:CAMPEP_0176499622 /NCGR_PEP_ID=MMETSP0200_2-20121128/13034_1 /TAXON_ID=947934 /ORGANISM="Chaetoceros sp., Strain GSL56" /LENGTH=551 /DNA_ID=CAMNT_0017898071 /DNA_START=125 /DNA_END=1780 /DNA_ORIENTATION=+
MTPKGSSKKRGKKVFIDPDSSSGTETYLDQNSDESSDNSDHQSKIERDGPSIDTSPQAIVLSTQPPRSEGPFAVTSSDAVANRHVSTSLDSLAMVPDNADRIITPRETQNRQGSLSSPKVVVTDHKDTNVPASDLVRLHDDSSAQLSVSNKRPSKLKLKMKGRSSATTCSISSNGSMNSDGEGVIILDENQDATSNDKSKDRPKTKNAEQSNSTPNRTKERSKRKSPEKASNKTTFQDDSTTATSDTPNNAGGVKRKKRKVGNHSTVVESSTVPPSADESHLASSITNEPKNTNSKENTCPTNAVVSKKKRTFQDQVLLHMLTSMKPFTLKSLATELRTTDIALHHLMLSLVDKGIIRRKEFGNKVKKELYWVDIESATKQVYGNTLPSHIEMENAKAELQQILDEESKYLETMKRMKMELSNEELSIKVQEEDAFLDNLRERVRQAKDRISNNTSQSSKSSSRLAGGGGSALRKKLTSSKENKPKTRKHLKKEINRMRNEWKARKEKCTDFIDNLADAMEKKPKDVIKMLDIETDEMLGVKIPPKQDLEN